MEVLHDLVGYSNRKIYQNTDWFCFSMDSIVLAHFVTISLQAKKILDLGTGTLPIPLILSLRTKATIYGIEIQKDLSLLAQKSVKYNHLEDQIIVINEDMKDYAKKVESDSFDTIVINPPYFKLSEKPFLNLDEHKQYARHEKAVTLEEIFPIVRKLLKNGGNFAMIHRTERFMDILDLYRQNGIEPKRIQFIYPKMGKDSNMVLVEGIKNGSVGLKILDPFYIHNCDGTYTDAYEKLMTEVTYENTEEL